MTDALSIGAQTAQSFGQAQSELARARLDGLSGKGRNMSASETDEAARDFEAVFLSEMIKPMFEGLETGGMFGGGSAEESYRALMIQEYGKVLVSTNTTGIADAVKAQLIEIQGQAAAAAQTAPQAD